MKISLAWISDYVRLPSNLDPKQIAHDLTMSTVEVEAVDDLPSLKDSVLEIDNKSLTNRPDLWGHYGVARELAAIYGLEMLALPQAPAGLPETQELVATVDRTFCRRFTLLRIAAPVVDESPQWLRSRLERISQRSVNLWTDLSNYVMFAVGQPTHIYDASRLTLPIAVERTASSFDLKLLNGESRLIGPGTPVIADASEPVALAGVMGGQTTVTEYRSQQVALEVANFDPTVVRKLSQLLDLRTESTARFEKGLDTPRIDQAVGLFLHLLHGIVPDATTIALQDVRHEETSFGRIQVDLTYLERRIGRQLTSGEVVNRLTPLGFDVHPRNGTLDVTVPTWRSTGDVSGAHDLVEEVARLAGYETFEFTPPAISLQLPRRRPPVVLDRRLREQLAWRGRMQEIITYPWVSDGFLAAFGFPKDTTVRFAGAPSPDRDSLRPSLLPNLGEAVLTNLRHFAAFNVFELGKVFRPGTAPTPSGQPGGVEERRQLAAVFIGADPQDVFFQAKGVIEMISRACHVPSLKLTPGMDGHDWVDPATRLSIIADPGPLGVVGLLAEPAARAMGLEDTSVACFEFALDSLEPLPSRENRYVPLSEYPPVRFDLSIVVHGTVSWADVIDVAAKVSPLVEEVSFIDEFRGSMIPVGKKSLTLRVRLQPHDRTLGPSEISDARSLIVDALARELQAELRG